MFFFSDWLPQNFAFTPTLNLVWGFTPLAELPHPASCMRRQEAGDTQHATFPRPPNSVVLSLSKNCAASRAFQQRPDPLHKTSLSPVGEPRIGWMLAGLYRGLWVMIHHVICRVVKTQ